MGMFDYVNYSCKCPVCDANVTGFQTKDCERQGLTKTLDDVNTFYAPCTVCNTWIEFKRISGAKSDFRENLMNSLPKLFTSIIGVLDENKKENADVKIQLISLLNQMNSESQIQNFIMSYHPIEDGSEPINLEMPSYTVTNKTVNRTINADNVTIDKLADILSTLIDDLQGDE